MRESIIMTVCDRATGLLHNTIRALSCSDLFDCEIVIVDDGSTIEYPGVKNFIDKGINIKWIRAPEYDAYRIGPLNNPARAFNIALAAAEGERVCVLSSDVIVSPCVLTRARSEYKPDLVWCPAVINLDDSREYCGPARIFPMPWMLYTSREALIAAGGWDENLLRGFSYDDNDIAGRLVLVTRGFIGDWNHIVWHQSHPNPMIGDSTYIDNGVWENKTYVREKWNGGIPFGLDDPFTVVAESYGGYTPLEFKHRCDSSTIIGRTLSPFVERA